jgi:hypothetical protein
VSQSQVLLADMPVLMDELLRDSLTGVDVELLPPGSSIDDLRHVEEDDAPPIVIVVADAPGPAQFERDLLVPHPQTIVLRVEDNGQLLASRSVQVTRRVHASTLIAAALIEAIQTAPSWRKRFA